jgi:hypothetical protein
MRGNAKTPKKGLCNTTILARTLTTPEFRAAVAAQNAWECKDTKERPLRNLLHVERARTRSHAVLHVRTTDQRGGRRHKVPSPPIHPCRSVRMLFATVSMHCATVRILCATVRMLCATVRMHCAMDHHIQERCRRSHWGDFIIFIIVIIKKYFGVIKNYVGMIAEPDG